MPSGWPAFSRLLMLDKRSSGLSDRVREAPTLETRTDDVRAVMDAAGSERAVLWSGHEGLSDRALVRLQALLQVHILGLELVKLG
jgi:hypothetical protein